MNNTDRQLLQARMDQCVKREFKLHTYKGIHCTDDYEFALELYESEGVYAISEYFTSLGAFPSYEVLLAYKSNLLFPVDINFLSDIRYDVATRESRAQIFYDDEERDYWLEHQRDEYPFIEQFKTFYYFFPELLDEFRMQLTVDMKSLQKHEINEELWKCINTCERMRVGLDELLYKYTNMRPPINYNALDLSMYNPNPTITE